MVSFSANIAISFVVTLLSGTLQPLQFCTLVNFKEKERERKIMYRKISFILFVIQGLDSIMVFAFCRGSKGAWRLAASIANEGPLYSTVTAQKNVLCFIFANHAFQHACSAHNNVTHMSILNRKDMINTHGDGLCFTRYPSPGGGLSMP